MPNTAKAQLNLKVYDDDPDINKQLQAQLQPNQAAPLDRMTIRCAYSTGFKPSILPRHGFIKLPTVYYRNRIN